MESYQNKNLSTIKNDLNQEFKNIDKNWERDDKEIYQAGLAIAKKYQTKMQSIFNGMGDDVNDLLNNKRNSLNKTLENTVNSFKGYSLLTKNKEVINNVAKLIDNAENEVLKIIEELKSSSEENTQVHQQVEKQTEAGYFTENTDRTLTMTSRVNKPRIDQVLEGLHSDTRLIDYSSCKNQKIKQKMESLIGVGNTCYITRGTDKFGHNTYVLIDKGGNKLSDRALIREGVKLTSSKQIKLSGIKKSIKTEEENSVNSKYEIGEKSNLSALKENPVRKPLINSIPQKTKEKLESSSNESTFVDFLSKTEQRLDELIKVAKKNGWELAAEPVSKLRGKSGSKMELHFITGKMEKDIRFINKKEQNISEELRDIIDSNETDYMNYLTTRIKSKRQDYDFLTKKENIFKNDGENESQETENIIDEAKKNNILYGLQGFGKLVNALIQAEGDSLGNDDRKLTAMKVYLRNAIHSIKNTENLQSSNIETISTELKRMFGSFLKNQLNGNLASIVKANKSIDELLVGDKQKVQESLRELGDVTTLFGNTHTTFLKEDLDDDLDLKGEEFDEYYNNIKTKLDISIESNHQLLDKLYNATDANTDNEKSIKTILIENGILPPKNILDKDKKVNKLCEKIKNDISQAKKSIEKNTPTKESIRSDMQQEKYILMSKSNKTEDDIARLQSLNILEQDSNLRNNLLDGQIQSLVSDTMKYSAIEDIVRGNVTPLLAKAAGGTSSGLYDDIVGAGGIFNRSDENSEMLGSITKMVAEEVIIMIVSAALVASGVGAGAGVALAASRVARLGMKVTKTTKIIKAIKTSKKLATIGNKVRKYKVVQSVAKRSGTFSRAMNQGLTHTILATTYRGEYDKDFNEHLVYLLQNTAMYSILGVVGQSAQSGRIAKWFTNKQGAINLSKVRVTSYIAEELAMNPADLAISYSFSNEPMTKQDVINNIAMGLVFESIPGVRNLVMGKNKWKVDGIEYKKTEIMKIAKTGEMPKKSPTKLEKEILKIEKIFKTCETEEELTKEFRKQVKKYNEINPHHSIIGEIASKRKNRLAEIKGKKMSEKITENKKKLIEGKEKTKKIVQPKYTMNEYFKNNISKLHKKNIWIDGKKYKGQKMQNNTLKLKEVDGKTTITISSFKQLNEKGQVNMFSDSNGNKNILTNKEKQNNETRKKLIENESNYVKNNTQNRVLKESIDNKKNISETSNKEITKGEANQETKKIDIKQESVLIKKINDITKYRKTLEAQKFLDNPDIPKPTNLIEIGGVKLLVSNKYMIKVDDNIGNREYIVGYAVTREGLEPRLFYYSQSGKNWHSTAGSTGDIYSKVPELSESKIKRGELEYDYEKGTVVNSELENAFQNLKIEEKRYDIDPIALCNRFNIFHDEKDIHAKIHNKILETMIAETEYDLTISDVCINNTKTRTFANLSSDVTKNDLNEMFSKIGKELKEKLKIDFDRQTGRTSSGKTDRTLGEIEYNTVQGTLNGKKIEIKYARSKLKPNLLWVEGILSSEAKITSTGLDSHKIDGGLLTTKPLEYTIQVPYELKQGKDVLEGNYIDIREYTQQNPLITVFKKAEQKIQGS